MKTKLTILILLFLTSKNAFTTVTDPISEINQYFNEAKKGQSYFLSSEILLEIPFDKFISIAPPFLFDENTFVHQRALDLIKRYALSAKDEKVRQQLVAIIIKECQQTNSGITGSAVQSLKLFKRNDFNLNSVLAINTLINQSKSHLKEIVLVSGFIGNDETIKILKARLESDSALTKALIWNVQLALARLGDEKSFEICFNKIKGLELNDKVVNFALPDLSYTRNPIGINFMLSLVLSDKKDCLTRNPDNEEPVICGYKIIELIAPCVNEFPVQIDEYGELSTENLEEALTKVRVWYSGKPVFTINNSIY